MDYLVSEFVQEFRDRIGDSSKAVPSAYILSYLRTALRRLARQEGMEKLFENKKTFELASINKDGTPSASWDLGKVGTLLDIPNIKMLKVGSNGVCTLEPRYQEYDDFFQHTSFPEQQPPGDPSYFTIEQIGPLNRLIFNRPPLEMIGLDLKFSAFHPRITSEKDVLQINYNYADILTEYVIILHKIETTDQATARALWEDLDVLTADAIELLAKRKTGLPPRRMKRSF